VHGKASPQVVAVMERALLAMVAFPFKYDSRNIVYLWRE
jgi:hypothetical protein